MEELQWILPEEEESIGRLHQALARELPGWPDAFPADLTHDLHLCRFLRGHQGDVEKAEGKLRDAVAYRMELIRQPPFASLRSTIGEDRRIDLSILPHAEEILRILPLRNTEGTASDGLPILLTLIRYVDFAAFDAFHTEAGEMVLRSFVNGMLEQRALVLHNRSIAEHRMVKCVDVRDFTGGSVTEFISKGRGLLSAIKAQLAVVQSFYPELLHQAIIFNAPAMFSNLFSLLSGLLNERMRSKISIVPVAASLATMLEHLDARAIHSWLSQACPERYWSQFVVPNGATECISCWLEEGETVIWKVSIRGAAKMTLKSVFMPGRSATACREAVKPCAISKEETVVGEFTGYHEAATDGVFFVCLDNSTAFWSAQTCSVEFKRSRQTQSLEQSQS
ncbi:hypothetical protein AB1Y20_017786 [Prymnesium parvum]|uniref:CRAL-TRIO domain-containing protein n=1 Tax=Prymnesium parvum TaxID=97485 RepID=A0AB34JLM4_PRYPA|mmetsp:Transcript_47476/g.117535  ORF Transcript_47476/g.117535 Transcript_47476/m.117535 type:complete len:394 (+) Transcript_47476:60-1241(+)